MKVTRLIIAALFLSVLSSCSLLNSFLRVPASLLKVVGRSAGIGLTDEAPDPVKPITVENSETMTTPVTVLTTGEAAE